MTGTVSRDLRSLAALHGVQNAYYGVDGALHRASPKSLLAALRALGCRIETPSQARALAAERRRALRERILAPVSLAWSDGDGGASSPRPSFVPIVLEARQARLPLTLELVLEDGARLSLEPPDRDVADSRALSPDGEGFVRMRLRLPETPLGYHRLHASVGSRHAESMVIRAPVRSYRRETDSGIRWGFFAPLSALHSSSSWGVGDFTDLEAACGITARAGGSFFATLPMLSGQEGSPGSSDFDPSPYSPGSRRFWNGVHVDPRRTPEWATSRARALVDGPGFRARIAAARAGERAHHQLAGALRRDVVRILSRECARSRPEALERFRSSFPLAAEHARFRAFQDAAAAAWPSWSDARRSGRLLDEDVSPELFRFHLYVQMLAEEQLAAVSRSARGDGVGLYFDLPVGVHREGFDAWWEQERFAFDADVGAPPDDLFEAGQNWSFAPLHPDRSRADGHRYFRDSLRHSMRHASVLRIDHVMGLHRQFWIPRGLDVAEGVYVRYPAEELYAIASLESHRLRCELAGENLGTVPAVVNETMRRRGLRGLHLMQFALTGRPDEPVVAPVPDSVASCNTHDTPSFAGFCLGRDVTDRSRRGGLDAETAERELASRRAAIARSDEYLGIAPDPSLDERLAAWLSYLLESDAGLVLVTLEDLWLEEEPYNVPGTLDERNWTRKLRYDLDALRERPELSAFPRRSPGG